MTLLGCRTSGNTLNARFGKYSTRVLEGSEPVWEHRHEAKKRPSTSHRGPEGPQLAGADPGTCKGGNGLGLMMAKALGAGWVGVQRTLTN